MTQELAATSKSVKCLVWDLDNTLWNGVLAEDAEVVVPDEHKTILKNLDERGILQSIASRNDLERVSEILEANGIASYFLYPQVNWGSKCESIKRIAQSLNIGIDAIAFVDDDAFERGEVAFELP